MAGRHMGPSLLFGGNLGIFDSRPPLFFFSNLVKIGSKNLKITGFHIENRNLMQFRFDCTQYHPRRPKFRPSQAKSCEKNRFLKITFTKSQFLTRKSRFVDDFEPFLFIHKRFPSILTIKSWYLISNFDPQILCPILGDALRHVFFNFFEKSTRISIKHRFLLTVFNGFEGGNWCKIVGGIFFPPGYDPPAPQKGPKTQKFRRTIRVF